jgi:isocitrate dehydrogenase kinase/phosphatase
MKTYLDNFELASGEPGMVMLVFTIPSYDMVFKVIRDRFPEPKSTTAREVRRRYRIVFERDRVGRLVEAQEFEHLKFARDRFAPELLEELLKEASGTVRIDGQHVVIDHLYTERKVHPLNLYLRQVPPETARQAVIDYGRAIKELAAANIFPGDFLLKNFGVTRHGRVVFYDYDELCLLSECNFRRMPPPRTPEDELAAEPWFTVAPNDVFPEEFRHFLGFPDELLRTFEHHHSELFDAEYWRSFQKRHEAGEILDFYPYANHKRLHLRDRD